MILILGDLLADLSLRIESFPVQAGGMQRVSYFELGPGGAANTAIAAARLGLAVGQLGEIGDDRAGRWILEDLRAEGLDVSGVIASAQATTAVAGVIVNFALGPDPRLVWVVANVAEPLGRVWLNALIMVVIPLIIATVGWFLVTPPPAEPPAVNPPTATGPWART